MCYYGFNLHCPNSFWGWTFSWVDLSSIYPLGWDVFLCSLPTLFLFRYNWHIPLYWFQVYKVIYLCTCCVNICLYVYIDDHYSKSNFHYYIVTLCVCVRWGFLTLTLKNFQLHSAALLTLLTMLYTLHPVTYFITGSFCLLTPFNHFANPLLLTSSNHQSVLCICKMLVFFFGFVF